MHFMREAILDTSGLRVAFAQPLYSQVRAQILKRISVGEWGAGEALPNEFALASEYRVSVGTVRRAVEGLEKEGMLVRKQGRGTFVAGSGRTPLQDKFTALRRLNGERAAVGYRLESIRRRDAGSEEAADLGCIASACVLDVEQSVTLGDQVVGVERSIISAEMFPRMESQVTYGQHLYPVFNLYGYLVTRATDVVSIVDAGEMQTRLLGVPPRHALLQVKRVAFTHSDKPIELRLSQYNAMHVCYATAVV